MACIRTPDEVAAVQNQNTQAVPANVSPAMTAGDCHVPGLGDMAPDFTANTTDGVKTLSVYRGRWVILFSHPGDFTPVTKRQSEFPLDFNEIGRYVDDIYKD